MRAIMVDLDGTLVDTTSANVSAYIAALQEVGVDIPPDIFAARSFGLNWRQFLPEMLAEAGVTVAPSAVARRKQALYAAFLPRTRVNRALVSLIKTVRGSCRSALVTSASAGSAAAVLEYWGLTPMFDVIVTADDVEHHKPSPAGYALAADRMGVSPGDCVVVEDSDPGVAAAMAFGAQVFRTVWAE